MKSFFLKIFKGTDLKHLATHLREIPEFLLLISKIVTCTVPRNLFISSNMFFPVIILRNLFSSLLSTEKR